MSTLSAFSIGKLSRTTPFPAISTPGTRLLRAFGPPVLLGISYYLGTRIGVLLQFEIHSRYRSAFGCGMMVA